MKWSNFTTKQKIGIVAGIFALAGLTKAFESPKPLKNAVSIEKTAEVLYEKGDIMPVADYIIAGVTKEDYKAVSEALRIKDKLGIEELIVNTKAVPLEKGQKVMLLNPGFASSLWEVRIQEGSQSGRSCYIPYEYFTGKFN